MTRWHKPEWGLLHEQAFRPRGVRKTLERGKGKGAPPFQFRGLEAHHDLIPAIPATTFMLARAVSYRAAAAAKKSASAIWDQRSGHQVVGRIPSQGDFSSSANRLPSGNSTYNSSTPSSSVKSMANTQPSGNLSGTGIVSTDCSVAYPGHDGRLVPEAINKIAGGTNDRPGAWGPTPDQMDILIGQLTGGPVGEPLKANQTIAATATGDELPPYKMPLVGRLYGNTRGPAGQSERFYENMTLLNELENELKGRIRNRENTEGFRKGEPLVALIGMGNQTESQIRKVRELRRREVERKDAGYQVRVKDIDGRIGEAMTRLNSEVARVRTKEAAK